MVEVEDMTNVECERKEDSGWGERERKEMARGDAREAEKETRRRC
jgi:hypothetical protein